MITGKVKTMYEDALKTKPVFPRTVPSAIPGLIDLIYPIGSIYMSVNSVKPSALFGGTWEQIQDRFLLASGSSYSAGSTGGEASHTLTIDEMPKHNHQSLKWMSGDGSSFGVNDSGNGTFRMSYTMASSDDSIYTGYKGENVPHNNMPPYLAVYVWKRTA